MKVILLGASGMIGSGVLLECLDDAGVERVLVVGRTPCGVTHPKVEEVLHPDFLDFSPLLERMRGYDACFWCLGVSSAGMSEENYKRITLDYTVAGAKTLLAANPALIMCFISGESTDSTGQGRVMWARIKGQAENHLKAQPFKAVYCFRPGLIQPMRGIKSKTKLYSAFYAVTAPILPLMEKMMPKMVTTTERVGKAMIEAVRHGSTENVIRSDGINQLALRATSRS